FNTADYIISELQIPKFLRYLGIGALLQPLFLSDPLQPLILLADLLRGLEPRHDLGFNYNNRVSTYLFFSSFSSIASLSLSGLISWILEPEPISLSVGQ